jgi:outer membrane lipoprotein-sorting protein
MLRCISTTRLLIWILAVVALVVAATAVTALAVDSGPTPPPLPLAQAIHDSLSHGAPVGLSAEISFTNSLVSSTTVGNGDGSGLGGPSPLLTGASGRLWISGGRVRLELQASNGDTEIVVSHGVAMLEDVATNTVYEATLPATGATGAAGADADPAVPSVASIENALTKLMGAVDIGGAVPTDIGGEPAYTVRVTPKHPGGLLGAAEIGWDALHGIPLDVAIYAAGDSTPVLALSASSVSFGPVNPGVFTLEPPPGARVVQMDGSQTRSADGKSVWPVNGSPIHLRPGQTLKGGGSGNLHRLSPVTSSGVDAVRAAVSFQLDAPATLGGLARRRVSMIGWGGRNAALALYGSGLASVAVVETAAPSPGRPHRGGGPLGPLPSIQVNGASASELQTALGTLVEFSRDGVQYVIGGLVPAATVESVARGL